MMIEEKDENGGEGKEQRKRIIKEEKDKKGREE